MHKFLGKLSPQCSPPSCAYDLCIDNTYKKVSGGSLYSYSNRIFVVNVINLGAMLTLL